MQITKVKNQPLYFDFNQNISFWLDNNGGVFVACPSDVSYFSKKYGTEKVSNPLSPYVLKRHQSDIKNFLDVIRKVLKLDFVPSSHPPEEASLQAISDTGCFSCIVSTGNGAMYQYSGVKKMTQEECLAEIQKDNEPWEKVRYSERDFQFGGDANSSWIIILNWTLKEVYAHELHQLLLEKFPKQNGTINIEGAAKALNTSKHNLYKILQRGKYKGANYNIDLLQSILDGLRSF